MLLSSREQIDNDTVETCDEFIATPSEKAVKDTLVIEKDGSLLKRWRQTVQGRNYLVCTQFDFADNGQSIQRKIEQVIDLTLGHENIPA